MLQENYAAIERYPNAPKSFFEVCHYVNDSIGDSVTKLHDSKEAAIREFYEANYWEFETKEALDHWVVSNRLAKALKAHDEMVKDVYGLNIWAIFDYDNKEDRGNSIELLAVIEDIYQEYLKDDSWELWQ